MEKSKVVQIKRREPGTQPKYKRELRSAIMDNVANIKNIVVLRHLYVISDIYCRWWYSDESYEVVTDIEKEKMILIDSILNHEDLAELENIRRYAYYVMYDWYRKRLEGDQYV